MSVQDAKSHPNVISPLIAVWERNPRTETIRFGSLSTVIAPTLDEAPGVEDVADRL